MTKRAKAKAVATVSYATIERAMRERYPASSHALLWEVGNATGARCQRHADAVVVGLWPSHGHAIEGFELKVSRGDWLRERAQPEKSAPVYRFCHHWWLLTPKGLVAADELPPTWGLLEVDEAGTSRVKVRAPRLEPEPVDMGFVAAPLRARAKPDERTVQTMIDDRVRKATEDLRAQVARERESERVSRAGRLERVSQMVEVVRERTGIDLTGFATTADDIVRLIRIARAMDGCGYSRLENLQRSAREVLAQVDGLIGEGADGG